MTTQAARYALVGIATLLALVLVLTACEGSDAATPTAAIKRIAQSPAAPPATATLAPEPTAPDPLPTPTLTPAATPMPAPAATARPTPAATATLTPAATATLTPAATATLTPAATARPTPAATARPTPAATATLTPAATATPTASPAQTMLPFVFFPEGATSLKERIARADVIARVRLQTVVAGSEPWHIVGHYPPRHIATLEHRFTVLEYLKGTGGTEIVAVVLGNAIGHDTKALAVAEGAEMLAARDTRWNSREALVFLQNGHPYLTGFPSAGRYELGSMELDLGDAGDAYSIASHWDKTWLPADAGAAGAAGALGTQRFLLDEPPAGATGRSGAAPTITLADMKTQVDEIRREVSAGDGSDAYRICIYEKYKWERRVDSFKAARNGGFFYKRFDESLGSGEPAGTLAHTRFGEPLVEDLPVTGEMRVYGQDRDLFVPSWPGAAHTARPLPAGEYRFYFSYLPERFIPCNAHPEEEQRRFEVFVDVTAPADTVHEALFDPAAIGTAVGADGTNGVVEPAGFNVGGTATTITGLKWEGGVVTLELSPAASLSGHALDFIALDGSVALSLDGGAATVSGGTLTWSVADQPWQAGDLLMLRIRSGSPAPPTAR